MAQLSLPIIASRSGYLKEVAWGQGPVYWSVIPHATADAGVDRSGELVETFRGVLAFDAAQIADGAALVSCTLTIPAGTTAGETALWTVQVYSGATLDPNDPEASWDEGELAYTSAGGPPGAQTVEIAQNLLDTLLVAGEAAFIIRVSASPEDRLAMWYPTVSGATCTVGYIAADLESDLGHSPGLSSDIATSSEKESDVADIVTLTSSLKKTEALTSSIDTSVELTSSLPTE